MARMRAKMFEEPLDTQENPDRESMELIIFLAAEDVRIAEEYPELCTPGD